ncbi:MAG TPA: PDZ domain-containing protein [Streptosporangiaceae bacterium]|nr:PDZ domain-containing protein [Streptosporangiaceae bacterium]
MSRRTLTLLIASIGTAAAIAVSVLIPVPYVILGPGPTLNTLGKDSSGQQLISIDGHATYPTSGHLNMVTVSYAGGPGSNINIFSAIAAWLNPSEAVVPETELFPAGTTQQQAQQQDTAQMASSQQLATAAAFTELGIKFTTLVTVTQTESGAPAASALKDGDVITAVDGQAVTGDTQLTSLIRSHPAGSLLDMKVVRNGQTEHVPVKTIDSGGHPIIGVLVTDQYKFPFNVKISIGDIGGPSAGMMFALGIIDKLTTDNLTGGKFIAGTGEIEVGGKVDAIGGIQQKMIGARNAGATVFLAPASNCNDVKNAIPAGLRVVKVSTLSQAVTYLEDIKAGQPVPSC